MKAALTEYLDAVTDEQTFLAFVRALTEDRIAAAGRSDADDMSSTDGWQNDTIESFLEAAQAWAEDSAFGADQGLDPASPWKKFATFLYCGRIYE